MKKLVFALVILFNSCSLSSKKLQEKPQKVKESDVVEMTYDKELNLAYKELIKSYQKKSIIDSIIIINKDTIEIKMTYLCLLDNKIVVPKSYLAPYRKSDLITHNFVVDLEMYKNKRILLQKRLTKNDFQTTFNEEIEKYGTLFFPEIRQKDNNIYIDISISIPLTDIGDSRSYVIDTIGNINVAPKPK